LETDRTKGETADSSALESRGVKVESWSLLFPPRIERLNTSKMKRKKRSKPRSIRTNEYDGGQKAKEKII
jgi:hypothetical protein